MPSHRISSQSGPTDPRGAGLKKREILFEKKAFFRSFFPDEKRGKEGVRRASNCQPTSFMVSIAGCLDLSLTRHSSLASSSSRTTFPCRLAPSLLRMIDINRLRSYFRATCHEKKPIRVPGSFQPQPRLPIVPKTDLLCTGKAREQHQRKLINSTQECLFL